LRAESSHWQLTRSLILALLKMGWSHTAINCFVRDSIESVFWLQIWSGTKRKRHMICGSIEVRTNKGLMICGGGEGGVGVSRIRRKKGVLFSHTPTLGCTKHQCCQLLDFKRNLWSWLKWWPRQLCIETPSHD
jgi:hypothetical protein